MAEGPLRVDAVAVAAARRHARRQLARFPEALSGDARDRLEDALSIYSATRSAGLSGSAALEVACGLTRNGASPSGIDDVSVEGLLEMVSRRPEDAESLLAGAHESLRKGPAPPAVIVDGRAYRRGVIDRPRVIGLDAQLSSLEQAVRLIGCYSPERLKNPCVDALDSAILLYGPPGTGKSTLCRYAIAEGLAVSARSGVPFRHALFSAADFSKWVGESAKQLQSKYSSVCSPDGFGLLVIDDIDMLFSARDTGESTGMLQVTAELMQSLSGVADSSLGNSLVLATTNRPDALDPAVRRRFGSELLVPSYDSVEQYLAFFDDRLPWIGPSGREYLASDSLAKGYSPSALDHLCRALSRERLGTIDMSFFDLSSDERYSLAVGGDLSDDRLRVVVDLYSRNQALQS